MSNHIRRKKFIVQLRWRRTVGPGKYVALKGTIRGFKAIIAGEYDNLPEQAVCMVDSRALEVQRHKITILADTAARAKDLDEAAALTAQQRAEEVLRDGDCLGAGGTGRGRDAVESN